MLFVLRRLLALPRSRYLQVILYKTYADLVAETQRYYIGYLWWIVEPVIDMAIYYAVFGFFLSQGTPDFAPFLLIGTVIWRWIETSVRIGASSILNSRQLSEMVALPKILFPTISFLNNTFKFFIVFFLLIGFLAIYGMLPGTAWFALPLLLLVEALFIASLMYILAALVPFFVDLRNIIDSGFKLLMFMSGVFYSVNAIPEKIRYFFYLNPVVIIIEGFRVVLMHNQPPEWFPLLIVSIVSLLGIALGIWLLRRNDTLYPKISQ